MSKRTLSIPAAAINGFNYQPSYSSCTFETWRCYDPTVFRRELSRGKELFPKMNAVRIWLSWNAWCRGPERFLGHVGQTLDICGELGLKVVPVLFNRWHDPMADCDGIYLDHFIPQSSWLLKYGLPGMDFVRDMGRVFASDQRILAWDLCNEPFVYRTAAEFPHSEEFTRYEQDWLRQVAARLEENGITQPVGVGTWGPACDPLVDDFTDVFMTHLYLTMPGNEPCRALPPEKVAEYEETVRGAAEYAAKAGKPIMTTETCWGSFDDASRVQLIEHAVRICRKYGLGIFAYALYESDFADLHRPELGRLSPDIGHLEFIRRDGSLRPGHDIINRFF